MVIALAPPKNSEEKQVIASQRKAKTKACKQESAILAN
jgi:hypothetical protein